MKLNESQFANMIADMTKQIIKESMGLNPEVGANEYEEQQNYFNSPEGDGMPMDDTTDANVEDGVDFLRKMVTPDLNPADTEQDHDDYFNDNTAEPTEPEFGSEPKEPNFPEDNEDGLTPDQIQEKQDRLLSFITENWNNHANNLIK